MTHARGSGFPSSKSAIIGHTAKDFHQGATKWVDEHSVLVKLYAKVASQVLMSFRSVLVLNLCLAIFAVLSLRNRSPDHYKDKIQEGLRLEGFEEYCDVDFERVSKGFLKIHCLSAV